METGEDHETLRENKRARLVGDEDEIGETRFLIRQEKYCRRAWELGQSGPAWGVITWSDKKREFRFSKYEDINSYPDHIEKLQCSATLLCDSKLFFISGIGIDNLYLSPSVDSFDMDCKTWKAHEDVKIPRYLHTAAAVGDYIYVFGSRWGSTIPPKEWAERFKIKDNKWDYLPEPPNSFFEKLHQPKAYAVYHNCPAFSYIIYANQFPQPYRGHYQLPPVDYEVQFRECWTSDWNQVDQIDQIPQADQFPDVDADQTKHHVDADQTEHRVDANQTLILFPLPYPGSPICVFNCTSNTWLPTIQPDFSGLEDVPIIHPNRPTLPDRLAIVDGVLIWHRTGSINGYDLINQKCLGSLFTIPSDQLEQNFGYEPMVPHDSTMFFIHIGDSLFLYFLSMPYTCNIHCYKFGVQKRKQGQDFRLLHENYQQLSTEYMEQDHLLDVFLL